MKYLNFLAIGTLFGIVLTKSEAISWFRIQEMFRFDSIHMYGIIGTAVISGILLHQYIKKSRMKTISGTEIELKDKAKTYWASILGGIIFGLGWAMTGACPGPLYILVGHGYLIMLVAIGGALFGTYLYGLMRGKLPH